MIRKILLGVTAVAIALPILPAGASHRPQSKCSASGDVCQSVRKVDGVRKLKITLQSDYFERYRLCVKNPDGATTCKGFRISESGEQFGDTVRWRKHFPHGGEGAYNVTWKVDGGRVGSRLGFHI